METFNAILEHWKQVLGAIAAVLFIMLQVVQLLLSSGIDASLAEKTEAIRTRTETVDALLRQHGKVTDTNARRIEALSAQLSAVQAELKDIEELERKK